MSLLFMDGFDQYKDEQDLEVSARWGMFPTFMPSGYIDLPVGRNGSGKALKFGGNYASYSIGFPIDGGGTTLICGFGFMIEDSGSTYARFAILDRVGLIMFYMRCSDTVGELDFCNGDGDVLGTISIGEDTWAHIEFKVTFHPTAGTLEVNVDGVQELDLTGLDTVDNSSADDYTPRGVILYSGTNSKFSQIDDIVVMDDQGSELNDFIGDAEINVLLPDGDDSVEWSRSTGSNNYENVDEAATDEDTTYNHSSAATDKDLLTFGDLGRNPETIHAVAFGVVARKEDQDRRDIKLHLNTGANSNDSGGLNHTIYDDYRHVQHIEPFQTGTTEWTESAVDAIKAGYEVV